MLDDILARLDALPEDQREQIEHEALEATKGLKFIPTPGPQTEAYFSPADILLYGGQAGGGKSALGVGLALNEHTSSRIMRRKFADLEPLIEMALKFNGTRDGFSGSPRPKLRTADGRLIKFGAVQHLGDEQNYMGDAVDLLNLDEVTHFQEIQVRFLMGWVRSEIEGQRCRVVMGSNPPISTVGDWIVGMFRPWLDVTHHNPAKAGELRWFIMDDNGKDYEVDGPEPREEGGRILIPKSRTFIPAALSDNPFLGREYQATLDALPEPLRSAVRDGNFMAARPDDAAQAIPTAWIEAAKARWRPQPPAVPMTAMAIDIAQGGRDDTTLTPRYDWYIGEIIAVPGVDTPEGGDIAVLVIRNRRDEATVILDAGGGYAGGASLRLKDNGIEPVMYKGGSAATRRSRDGANLQFFNKRSQDVWNVREALDPDQEGGAIIALPPDPEMTSDLASYTFDPEYMERGIVKIESKEEMKKRLGRSPDKGDGVVMVLAEGVSPLRTKPRHTVSGRGGSPTVRRAYSNRKNRRR